MSTSSKNDTRVKYRTLKTVLR